MKWPDQELLILATLKIKKQNLAKSGTEGHGMNQVLFENLSATNRLVSQIKERQKKQKYKDILPRVEDSQFSDPSTLSSTLDDRAEGNGEYRTENLPPFLNRDDPINALDATEIPPKTDFTSVPEDGIKLFACFFDRFSEGRLGPLYNFNDPSRIHECSIE